MLGVRLVRTRMLRLHDLDQSNVAWRLSANSAIHTELNTASSVGRNKSCLDILAIQWLI